MGVDIAVASDLPCNDPRPDCSDKSLIFDCDETRIVRLAPLLDVSSNLGNGENASRYGIVGIWLVNCEIEKVRKPVDFTSFNWTNDRVQLPSPRFIENKHACYTVTQEGIMATTTVTLRLAESEKQVLADYAKTFGMSISEFVRTAALSRIEDELDLVAWDEAKREFDDDPKTLSADEIAAKYL